MPILTDKDHCLICDKGPCRFHRFQCMFYWLEDWICEACWNIDTDEEKDGTEW